MENYNITANLLFFDGNSTLSTRLNHDYNAFPTKVIQTSGRTFTLHSVLASNTVIVTKKVQSWKVEWALHNSGGLPYIEHL